jgi:hypothetical protein
MFANDTAGLTSNCQFSITIFDNEAPTIGKIGV